MVLVRLSLGHLGGRSAGFGPDRRRLSLQAKLAPVASHECPTDITSILVSPHCYLATNPFVFWSLELIIRSVLHWTLRTARFSDHHLRSSQSAFTSIRRSVGGYAAALQPHHFLRLFEHSPLTRQLSWRCSDRCETQKAVERP